jgi:prepilin-type N-terminal cleavage/methylation domain-containing protein
MEITQMIKRRNKGFTLIELLVVIAIIALLMGMLLPALAKALDNARVRKDQYHLRGLTNAFAIHSESDANKKFPLPGSIDRQSVEMNNAAYGNSYIGISGNQEVPGLGNEDPEVNLSAWLHSYMVGAEYYEPQILISANESNPIVQIKGNTGDMTETPYDFDQIDTSNDQYWDPMFSADISGCGEGGGPSDVCHVSYANLALCGQRLKDWRTGSDETIVMSSRGPKDGAIEGPDFIDSPTLQLYGPERLWEGVYVSADGSSHYAKSMWFEGITYKPDDGLNEIRDNAFMADFADFDNTDSLGNAGGASGDTWMILNTESTATDVKTVWDLLPGETCP